MPLWCTMSCFWYVSSKKEAGERPEKKSWKVSFKSAEMVLVSGLEAVHGVVKASRATPATRTSACLAVCLIAMVVVVVVVDALNKRLG